MRFPRIKGRSSRKSGLNPILDNKRRDDSEAPGCEAPSKSDEGVMQLDAGGDSQLFKELPLHEDMQLVAYDQTKAIPGVPVAAIDCEDMSLISNITIAPAAAPADVYFEDHMDPFLCGHSHHHGGNYDIQLNAIAENFSCGVSLESATDGIFTDFLDAVDGGMKPAVQQLDLTSKPNSATGSYALIQDSSSDDATPKKVASALRESTNRAEDEGFEVQDSPKNSDVACVTPIQKPSRKRRVIEPLLMPFPAEEGVEVHLSQPEPCPITQLITKLAINETALQNERKAWETPGLKTCRSYSYKRGVENRPTIIAINDDKRSTPVFSPPRSVSKSLSRRKLEEKIEMEHQVQKRHKLAESHNISLDAIATDLSTAFFDEDIFDSESQHPLKAKFGAHEDDARATASAPTLSTRA